MDCQNIDSIGSKDGLLEEAENVRELDLAGNHLSSFEEVFKLLCWLKHLESLNLSRNPLGPHISIISLQILLLMRMVLIYPLRKISNLSTLSIFRTQLPVL
ncbi:unnamed protein product [Heterobilharzia americana]|nr:unnamed protein product [Heterobilharzia americana]